MRIRMMATSTATLLILAAMTVLPGAPAAAVPPRNASTLTGAISAPVIESIQSYRRGLRQGFRVGWRLGQQNCLSGLGGLGLGGLGLGGLGLGGLGLDELGLGGLGLGGLGLDGLGLGGLGLEGLGLSGLGGLGLGGLGLNRTLRDYIQGYLYGIQLGYSQGQEACL
jgi:hypothetical protein